MRIPSLRILEHGIMTVVHSFEDMTIEEKIRKAINHENMRQSIEIQFFQGNHG